MELRDLPSVDEVLTRLNGVRERYPRALVVAEIRRSISERREALRAGRSVNDEPVEQEVTEVLAALEAPSLRHVINATGVILHTNLGRAPLADLPAPGGYSNLEYDLAAGRRGKRDVHIGDLLERLTGKPGIAVNNNAAAVYLALNELAAGYEVIISRGELIEIGDGFRIPDIMLRAGVVLREVGTTNRTHLDDYRSAMNERTRLILRVHPSNFHISGFTGRPSLRELAGLGREYSIPVYEDLGSGCLTDLKPFGIDEPLVSESLEAGVNLVSFSGDKLLGGPQAGLLAGDPVLIQKLRRNPMFRALRLDKLIYGALETTLRHLVLERWDSIPAIRMIRLTPAAIRERAIRFLDLLPGMPAGVIDGQSVIGGGSTPDQSLATALIAIRVPSAAQAERKLRAGSPPVIVRIEDEHILVDLRTVSEDEEEALAVGLAAACA